MSTVRIAFLSVALIVVIGLFVFLPLRDALPVTAVAALSFLGGRRFFGQASKLP